MHNRVLTTFLIGCLRVKKPFVVEVASTKTSKYNCCRIIVPTHLLLLLLTCSVHFFIRNMSIGNNETEIRQKVRNIQGTGGLSLKKQLSKPTFISF